MGTKTIALTEDAYRRLLRMKRTGESFSDVVKRLTGRGDLLRFAGSISPEFAEELRASVRETRRAIEESFEARRRRFFGE